MATGFSSINREAPQKIRFGSQLMNQSHLRQHLLKEITELEARMSALERTRDTKHTATLDNYRAMILERLHILQNLLSDET